MPLYSHVCKVCGYEEEFVYSMSECNDEENNKWNNIDCPICLKEIEMIKNDGIGVKFDIKLKRQVGDVSILRFQSFSLIDKKKMLQKRSHEHFKKHIKESWVAKNKFGYTP